MRTLGRCALDLRSEWRQWLPPVAAVTVAVPLVLALPLLQRRLVDGVLLAGRLDLLLPTLAAYGAVWLAVALLQLSGAVWRTRLDERLTLRLRQRLYDHCEALSVPLWHSHHGGQTMALFSQDVPSVAAFAGSTVVATAGSVAMLAGGGLAMLHLSWQLTAVVVAAPPVVAGLALLATRAVRRAAREAQDRAADLSEHLHEALAGLRESAAFAPIGTATGTPTGARRAALAATLQDVMRLRVRLSAMGAIIGAGQSLFSLAVMVAMLGAGGYLVITHQITLGTVLAMEGIFSQVYPTATALVGTAIGAQKVLASADRLYAFLDQQPRVRECPGARPVERCAGAITLEQVSFGYVPGRPVLREVSLAVGPGETMALVGPSGSGKSTLAGLVARFYDPDQGRILLDGQDLRDLALDGLRRQMGMVFQDSFLFATTVRENLTLGHPGAGDAQVEAAARAAHAWEFIERLPEGLETRVGQRAVQLSEGQKQRLAVARALLRDPRILILDEPTSALDARSEHLLQQALDRLMSGRTTVVIAHRLSTVRRADRIVVLDQGRVVEQGTHGELLARGGLYCELHELQRWWK